jgi:uncharacterized protein YjdB
MPTGRTLAIGDSLQLHAESNLAGVTGWAWAASNESYATVDAAGLVRGTGTGTVAVTACAKPVMGWCGSATVSVR